MPEEEIKLLTYVGDADFTIWIEEVNSGTPLIFPSWPNDFPNHVALYASAEGEFAVALSRKAMLEARDPARLWFCCISLNDLLMNTDARASWFKGE